MIGGEVSADYFRALPISHKTCAKFSIDLDKTLHSEKMYCKNKEIVFEIVPRTNFLVSKTRFIDWKENIFILKSFSLKWKKSIVESTIFVFETKEISFRHYFEDDFFVFTIHFSGCNQIFSKQNGGSKMADDFFKNLLKCY